MSLEGFAQDVSQDLDRLGIKKPPPVHYRVADSPSSAPGWREIDTQYTCVPDPTYPWDPKIMKAIQEFAPDAVPLWVHWVFMSPKETGNPQLVVFGRHALGRAVRNPGSQLEPFRCLMPTMPCRGLTFTKPNRIWFIHEGSPDERYLDLPGSYLPFDGSILDRAKRSSTGFQMTEKEFIESLRAEFIEKQRAAEEAALRAREEDMAARDADFMDYAVKQFERISEVEMKEHMGRKGEGLPLAKGEKR